MFNFKTKFNFNEKNLIFTLLLIASFFIARISIFHMLNPIIIAYLGCILFTGKLFYFSLGLSTIGFLSNIDNIYISKYIICICILFTFDLFFNKEKYSNILHKSLFSSLSILISGIVISILNNFSSYYLIISILESSLTFFITIILNKGICYLVNYNKKIITNEEIISIAVFVSSFICGSINMSFSVINVTNTLICILLIFVSYIYGSTIGGISSILSCFLLVLTGNFPENLLIVFTVTSIIAGLVRYKNKIIYAASFGISIYFISLMVDISLLNSSIIFSIFLAVIIFLSIPCKRISSVSFNASFAEQSATYTEKLKSITSSKLTMYADSFEKLSKTFENLSERKNNLDNIDISNLIDDVVSKVCAKCSLKSTCWEKNFYNSYQNIFSLLNNQENAGNFSRNNIPLDFLRMCINTSQFIDVLNKTVEIYKINLMWKNKLIESRQIVGQQLTGVSNIMNELSVKLCEDINFNESLATKIKQALILNKIDTKDVIITENSNGKMEVLLKVEPCYIPNKCSKSILSVVNEILDKKMCRDCYECIIKKENNNSVCSIKLVEEKKFRIKSTTISSHKYTSQESGDSHTSINLPDGKFLLAISDGMGSGSKAKAESSATIELLENFLTAGFANELTLNMINSVLFLKSSKESFATLDMCIIDLYTGIAEFIKIGAVSTFLIRKDKVEILKSSSLPVGILNNLDPEIKTKKLCDEDIIIMISDGVSDSKEYSINNDEWIVDFLSNLKTNNLNEIANLLFEETKNNYSGQLKDDITIIVSKIWSVK